MNLSGPSQRTFKVGNHWSVTENRLCSIVLCHVASANLSNYLFQLFGYTLPHRDYKNIVIAPGRSQILAISVPCKPRRSLRTSINVYVVWHPRWQRLCQKCQTLGLIWLAQFEQHITTRATLISFYKATSPGMEQARPWIQHGNHFWNHQRMIGPVLRTQQNGRESRTGYHNEQDVWKNASWKQLLTEDTRFKTTTHEK